MASSTSSSSLANRFITEGEEVPFWHLHIGEEEERAVADALKRKRFSMGPVTHELEEELARQLDVPHALCVSNGSAALLMSLAVQGIGPGDEVLVPTRTFIATAHAASLIGAKPVLVDCEPDRPAIDMADAARKVSSRTRAIMPVHLNGRSADMDAVLAFASKHNLVVIEDACQGLFSWHRLGYQGTIGHSGCFSFSMVKLVATGQGGAVVTRDKTTFDKLYRFRNHGVADVISHTYLAPGGNFKFTDIAASIGLHQVRRRTQKVTHVTAIYRRYCDGLADLSSVKILPVAVHNGEVPLWTEVTSPRRDALMQFLSDHGIQTRRFLPCCHTAPHFSDQGPFPHSERFAREGFNLPCGPDFPLDRVNQVIEKIREYCLP